VFVGSAPPTRSLPSSTNDPPSPFVQNPSPSRVTSTVDVNESYSSQTSMSSGVTPAVSNACRPDRTQGDSVKSGHSLIVT
jgi:hypothetical protein